MPKMLPYLDGKPSSRVRACARMARMFSLNLQDYDKP